MKKVYVIINTTASVGNGWEKWMRIKSILDKNKFAYDYDITESKNHATVLAIKAVNNNCKTIIIAGGDGTANEVINGLIIQDPSSVKDVNIGIIPIGTGNDWCRSLEIPNSIEEAIDIIKIGRTIKHDVGIVEYSENERRKKRYFINIAGLGFDSIVLKKTNEVKEKKAIKSKEQSKKKNNERTYLQVLLKTLLFYKPVKMVVEMDEEKAFSKNVFSMAVGIGKFNGNGMQQLPNALLNDGLFDINIIRAVSKVRIIKNLGALYNGTIHKKSIVSMYRAKKVKIKTESFALVETDGELLGESPFEFSILPQAINVFSSLE